MLKMCSQCFRSLPEHPWDALVYLRNHAGCTASSSAGRADQTQSCLMTVSGKVAL